MKTLKAISIITIVSIACTGLFLAMFQQFEAMLICLTISFVASLFIKL